MSLKKEIAIGIDLGTTFSCAAYFHNEKIEIIESKTLGTRTIPSVVTFNDKEITVGKFSKINENCIYEIKRIIGQGFYEGKVQDDIEKWSFTVVEEENKAKIKVKYKNEIKTFFPEEISAIVLKEIKKNASIHLNQEKIQAVITVPAYFNDSQRQATKDAGEIAGIEVLKLINEPTAAALAYGYNNILNKKSTILVFDLGGGTFDVSIMEVDNGEFKVLGIGGDTHLGGSDFDNRLLNYFVDYIKQEYNKDLKYDKKALNRLRSKCEETKRELTFCNSISIEIDSLFDGEDFIQNITRTQFEELNKDLFLKTIEITKKVIDDCKLDKTKIDDIVLVGGSTRIPKIQNLLSEFFNGKSLKQDINPDEAVAMGAALQAEMLIRSPPPGIKKTIDCIPKSIGIENGDGNLRVYFKKFSSIPNKFEYNWTTKYDFQKKGSFKIYEGEDQIAKNNTLLGRFTLENIKSALKGVPRIKCILEIDEDGILSAKAFDLETNSTNQITITKLKDSLNHKNLDEMINKNDQLFEN